MPRRLDRVKARFSYQLRDARRTQGWSQLETATALQEVAAMEGYPPVTVDANTISRWERAVQQPRSHHMVLLSHLFPGLDREEVPAHNLSSSEPLPLDSSTDPGRWERLARAVRQSPEGFSQIDEPSKQVIEAQIKAFYAIWLTTPASQIESHLGAFIDRLFNFIKRTLGTDEGHQLMVDVGEMLAWGSWLVWDMGNSTDAEQLYKLAAQAAHRVGDQDLLAWIEGNESYISSQRGNHQHALELLDAALTRVDSPTTKAWLEARKAEELAYLGDPTALAVFERSRDRFSEGDLANDRRWTNSLPSTWMENFAVNIYLELGLWREAEELAMAAIQSIGHPKLRPVLLADAATIQVKIGNLKRGCELAEEVVSTAIEMESRWVISRIQRLGRLLRSVSSAEAVNLAAQIAALSDFKNVRSEDSYVSG